VPPTAVRLPVGAPGEFIEEVESDMDITQSC